MGSGVDEAKRAKTKRKGRTKDKKYKKSARRSFIPRSIVCSASSRQPDTIELGLIISMGVLFLFFYGFYTSSSALPETLNQPNWRAHMGENFNLANPTEWIDDDDGGGSDSSEEESGSTDDASSGGNTLGIEKINETAKNLPLNLNIKVKEAFNSVPWRDSYLKNKYTTIPDIPAGIWPVTIRNELDDFETIMHADGKTELSVPKFWSKPLHQGKLMNKHTAMQVGTCAAPNPSGSYTRGAECPVDQRTIFVSIASYRDFECRTTVETIFTRAKHPERVRVGVVDQIVDGEDVACNEPILPCSTDPEQALCKYKDRVDVYEMEAQLSVGPVFARHIGYRLYRGEYYATQSDAHVSFTQDWDSDIISQLEATGNEMGVLSTYLTDVQGSIDENGNSLRHTRPIMCNTVYEGGPQGMHLRHASQPERDPTIHGMPQLQPWWAAGYSFSRGHFVVNVPYDLLLPMIFQGEEMSIGIRGFTIGYDYYAPERSVCFHHYAVGKNAKVRNKVHHFWENGDNFRGVGKKAMARLLGIVHMNPETDQSTWDHADEDIYGIGGVRTPEKFYETFGIDVQKKTIEEHMCSFVHTDGRMHKMFMKELRTDGMGIDYDHINFKFVDPQQGELP